MLRETTTRGLCGLGCPSRTRERGGEGDCVKGGGGEEGYSWGSVQAVFFHRYFFRLCMRRSRHSLLSHRYQDAEDKISTSS